MAVKTHSFIVRPSIGSHGHAGGTSPDQARKTPKDLSAHESEERGCGESVGFHAVYMVSEKFCLL